MKLIEYIHPKTGARRYGKISGKVGNKFIIKDYSTGKKVQVDEDKLVVKE